MSNISSLATHYRPQTFAEVVGQEMVTSILSRAARENRIAHGYVFSGTRGVGKTTIARIFAKAINCRNPKNGEPCNECDICKSITQGNFVDVIEIDAASNNGVENIRHLKEIVGFTPMQGKYKVFILDEAHMLSTGAANAFLKTLEEPPKNVVFILATTELQKFMPTILSRCQQFVFRQVPEDLIEAHLCDILQRENWTYEDEAVRLLALRASGSVRDSMSLMGQVLSFDSGNEKNHLTAKQVRQVLGLAGRDVLNKIIAAISRHDSKNIIESVKEILNQGIDISFFVSELVNLWRTLFLIRQAGSVILESLPLSYAEKQNLKKMAEHFTLTFLHSAWQMTLDAQQRLKKSVDSANDLELLLLNLSMIPLLIPLEEMQVVPFPKTTVSPPDNMQEGKSTAVVINTQSQKNDRSEFDFSSPSNSGSVPAAFGSPSSDEPAKNKAAQQEPIVDTDINKTAEQSRKTFAPNPIKIPAENFPNETEYRDIPKNWEEIPVDSSLSWESFLDFAEKQNKISMPALRQVYGEVHGNILSIQGKSIVNMQFLQKPEQKSILETMVKQWAGRALVLIFLKSKAEFRTEAEIKAELADHPIIKRFQEEFGATLEHCKQKP